MLLHEVLLEHGLLLSFPGAHMQILQKLSGQPARSSPKYVRPTGTKLPEVLSDPADTIGHRFSSGYDVGIAPEAQVRMANPASKVCLRPLARVLV